MYLSEMYVKFAKLIVLQLLFVLVIPSSWAMTDSERTDNINAFKDALTEIVHKNIDDEEKYEPENHEQYMIELLDELYLSAIISLEQYNTFKDGFMEVAKRGTAGSEGNQWKRGYNEFIEEQVNVIKDNKPPCIGEEKVANTGYCCEPDRLVKLPWPWYERNTDNCGKKELKNVPNIQNVVHFTVRV
jgi:hypothetical protein